MVISRGHSISISEHVSAVWVVGRCCYRKHSVDLFYILPGPVESVLGIRSSQCIKQILSKLQTFSVLYLYPGSKIGVPLSLPPLLILKWGDIASILSIASVYVHVYVLSSWN